MIPINRKEMWLNKICYNTGTAPTQIYTREENFFAEILGENVPKLIPISRYEKYLAKIAGRNIEIPIPKARIELYLALACGEDVAIPIPITREEIYWYAFSAAEKITNTLPLTFKASGNILTDYSIYGNAGGVGDLVVDETDPNYNKYKIPIKINGKNLLPSINKTATISGLTFTHNDDGSITLNGTSTAAIVYRINAVGTSWWTDTNVTLQAGRYYINSTALNAANDRIQLRQAGTSTYFTGTFTVAEPTAVAAGLLIHNRQTYNNFTIYPQLEFGRVATGYEPYHPAIEQNIYLNSPISENAVVTMSETNTIIPTINGTNILSFGTSIQPDKMYIRGQIESIEIQDIGDYSNAAFFMGTE